MVLILLNFVSWKSYTLPRSDTPSCIGKLNDHGFSTTFSGGKCLIQGPDGSQVGEVLKDKHGLYRVQHEHELEEANAVAAETLTCW